MTSILQELQAGYDQRAQQAPEQRGPDGRLVAFTSPNGEIVWLLEPLEAPTEPRKRKATRTYTGAELERRRAWGRLWGTMNAEHARKLRAGEVG